METSHAEHFLSRLDRLPRSEIDLALELYRDPTLLRFILSSVSLPDGAERVAISIDDPVLGPFLIVTRNGDFVTCLGRGMRPGEHPVVTRGQLDALAAKGGVLRERIALATKLGGGGERAASRLLRRLVVSPDTVSREDFLAVSAWEPILAPAFLDMYLGMSADLLRQAPLLRRVRVSGARTDEALHAHWNLLHAAGHMALLATMGGDREHLATVTENVVGARSAFTYALTGTGVIGFIVKGAWAAGRFGKLLLPAYKKAIGDDVALFELFDTLFALLAIGRRTTAMRAEIAKALAGAADVARTPEAKRLREAMKREIEIACEVTANILESTDEELEQSLLSIGAGYFDGDGPEDALRADLARTLPLMSWADGITNGKKLVTSLTLIGASARGEPEQFYLPRDVARVLHRPWEPGFTRQILEPMTRAERAGRKPAVRVTTVGRNDPCPCGSGKKHKKCCGG
jgi:hypothetical protein